MPIDSSSTYRPFRWLAPLGVIASVSMIVFAELWAVLSIPATGTPTAGLAFIALFLSSFQIYVVAGCLGFFLVAMLLRQRAWAAIAVAASMLWGLPFGWSLIRPIESIEPTAPTITVLSANILYGRGKIDDLLAVLDRIDPDVLLLQEFTPEFERMHDDVLSERFPHCIARPSDGAFGQATYSRLPFVEPHVLYPSTAFKPSRGWPPQIQSVIRVAGTDLSIVNVHLLPPTGFRLVQDQDTMSRSLADALENRSQISVIASGDFNSNEHGIPVRNLLAAGFQSVHTERGRGIGATWPRTGMLRYLPGTRLDHVLYRGDSLRLIDQGVGEDIGSDHAPVWATFEVVQRTE